MPDDLPFHNSHVAAKLPVDADELLKLIVVGFCAFSERSISHNQAARSDLLLPVYD